MAEQEGTPEICPAHPVLLIGGNGTVGTPLLENLRNTHGLDSVLQASRSAELAVDITDFETVYRLLHSAQPSVIILLAAMTNVNGCEVDQQAAWDANCHGVMNVVAAASSLPHLPLIVYTSTDFVFPGEQDTPYREEETPHPKSVYGITKFAGEIAVQNYPGRKLVLRISYPWHTAAYHLAHPNLKDTPKWIAATLLAGKDVPAFTNVVGNWTPLQEFTSGFWEIIHTAATNGISTLHIGGSTATPYQVAVAVHTFLSENSTFHLGSVIVNEFQAGPNVAPRPAQGGMDITKAKQLGIGFDPIVSAILNGTWMKPEEILQFAETFAK